MMVNGPLTASSSASIVQCVLCVLCVCCINSIECVVRRACVRVVSREFQWTRARKEGPITRPVNDGRP